MRVYFSSLYKGAEIVSYALYTVDHQQYLCYEIAKGESVQRQAGMNGLG